MANGINIASTVPLPTTLGGATVTIRDSLGTEQLASLFFTSPGQINCHIPAGLAPGAANVTVTTTSGAEINGALQIANVAPGLFSASATGQGVAAALAGGFVSARASAASSPSLASALIDTPRAGAR